VAQLHTSRLQASREEGEDGTRFPEKGLGNKALTMVSRAGTPVPVKGYFDEFRNSI
jgi:hypothetical protein